MADCNPEENVFDLVVSLGGTCATAFQLKHRGLRVCALPFDWTLMTGEKVVRYLPAGIRGRLADLCLLENLVEYAPPRKEHGRTVFHYEDRVSGWQFNHHFHGDIAKDRAAYASTKDVLDRRVGRLFRACAAAKRVLFVLQTHFPYDPALAEDVLAALAAAFPGVEVHLRAMQFAAGATDETARADGRLRVCRFAREFNTVYDNRLTDSAWCWMDALELRGRPAGRARIRGSWWLRLQYHLWKRLGTHLEEAGCACLNVQYQKVSDFRLRVRR